MLELMMKYLDKYEDGYFIIVDNKITKVPSLDPYYLISNKRLELGIKYDSGTIEYCDKGGNICSISIVGYKLTKVLKGLTLAGDDLWFGDKNYTPYSNWKELAIQIIKDM